MKERDTYKPSEWYDGKKWIKCRPLYPTCLDNLNLTTANIRAGIGQTQSGLRWWRPWLWGEPKGMKLICKDREMSIDEVKHVVEYGIVGIVRRAEYEAYPEKLDATMEDE